MLEDVFFNLGISYLLLAVKNKTKRKQLRAVFLKVFLAIKAAFPTDKAFQ